MASENKLGQAPSKFDISGCISASPSPVIRRPDNKQNAFTAVLSPTHAVLHNPACELVRKKMEHKTDDVSAGLVDVLTFPTYRDTMRYVFGKRGYKYPVSYCKQASCSGSEKDTKWERLPHGVTFQTGLSSQDVWEISEAQPTNSKIPTCVQFFDVENSATLVKGVGFTDRRIREITFVDLISLGAVGAPLTKSWKFKSGKYNKKNRTFAESALELVGYLNKFIARGGRLCLIAHKGKDHDAILLRKEFRLAQIPIPDNWFFGDSLRVAKQLFLHTAGSDLMPQTRELTELLRPFWGTVVSPLSPDHAMAVLQITRNTTTAYKSATEGMHTSLFDTIILRDLVLLWLDWIRFGGGPWVDTLVRLGQTWKAKLGELSKSGGKAIDVMPMSICHFAATPEHEQMVNRLFSLFDGWVNSTGLPESDMDELGKGSTIIVAPTAAPSVIENKSTAVVAVAAEVQQVASFPGSRRAKFHNPNKGCVMKAKAGANIKYMTKQVAVSSGLTACAKCRP